jgi:hypothetical protein
MYQRHIIHHNYHFALSVMAQLKKSKSLIYYVFRSAQSLGLRKVWYFWMVRYVTFFSASVTRKDLQFGT